MSENLSQDKDIKLFEMKKRDGKIAQFRFVKQDNVWYWDILHKKMGALSGCVPSLPLPDIALDSCNSLKECFNAIAQKRGYNWVGEIYADIMATP